MPVATPPTFAEELTRHGPESAVETGRSDAEAYCRRLAGGHYENFPVATRLLPRRLRQPFCNVYAFCRWADDLGDEVAGADESLRLLSWWREELADCFDGRPRHPVFVALRPTIEAFGLPRTPFEDLISAFEQDQTVTRHQTFEGLLDYCTRSANPVGRIVLRLLGADSPENVARSDSVCTGLQLINFWQDVARDADIGRRYLPADRTAAHGYTDAMWSARETNGALRSLGEDLVADAVARLQDGSRLAASVPGLRPRAVVGSFHRGGLAVASRIRGNGFDLWRRPVVGKAAMAGVLSRSLAAAAFGGRP